VLEIGLIVNPLAGIGGAVGLKGSDGESIVARALALGAEKKAGLRTRQALALLKTVAAQCHFITCPGEMGADWLAAEGLAFDTLDLGLPVTPTCAEHTRRAAQLMLERQPALLLFAGGDGTARDICAIVGDRMAVLGIPAGVKIHSGVYGITPQASGEVIRRLVSGQLVDIREAEVRDLDEDAFRAGQVRARHYGDMNVPQEGHFVQAVKQGGVEVEELVLADIAACCVQEMDDHCLYLIGSGKTTLAITNELGLPGTLLGVDAVVDGQLLQADVNEDQIWQLLQRYPQRRALLSVMGGQGHILGRGNQQFSPRILRALGRDNMLLVSTKSKITALAGRPLIVDSGDPQLDQEWAGVKEILTGYQDRILYPVGTGLLPK
jgi:predicted polyphosphate/ATP-dependent NAD kinase